MRNSKISLHKWLVAIYLSSTSLKGVSSRKLANDLGMKQPHAWHFYTERIREAMEQKQDFSLTLLKLRTASRNSLVD